MPQVSVLMPVYNREQFVAKAIESILGQTFADFELLIVDDASEDNSVAIVAEYANRDRRIRFFQLEHNSGAAAARNVALCEARGEFIAIADSDDICLPERLRLQMEFLERNPFIGSVGTHQRWVDPNLHAVGGYGIPLEHARIVLNLFVGGSHHGPTVMIRRSRLEEVGGFRHGVRRCEDMELYLRLLRETDIRFANFPDVLYLYRVHDQQNSGYMTAGIRVVKDAECVGHRDRALEYLWGEPPNSVLSDRFYRMRVGQKLGWADRRAAKRDMLRLIDSLIDRNWVDAKDRLLLHSEMNSRIEQASPRLWQQFCHWYRFRIKRAADSSETAKNGLSEPRES